jgi:hypothetical protein
VGAVHRSPGIYLNAVNLTDLLYMKSWAQAQNKASEMVPPAPVRVYSQWTLAPSVTSVKSVG